MGPQHTLQAVKLRDKGPGHRYPQVLEHQLAVQPARPGPGIGDQTQPGIAELGRAQVHGQLGAGLGVVQPGGERLVTQLLVVLLVVLVIQPDAQGTVLADQGEFCDQGLAPSDPALGPQGGAQRQVLGQPGPQAACRL